MLLNLGKQFLSKAIYGVLGAVGVGVTVPDTLNIPEGEPEQVLWKALLYGAITGMVAALNRFRTWDKEKAGEI